MASVAAKAANLVDAVTPRTPVIDLQPFAAALKASGVEGWSDADKVTSSIKEIEEPASDE